jgi:hypothetical protein
VEDQSEASDSFGWSISSGNFNGDRYSDLAIGAIGENSLTGAVNVLHGSAAGLSATATLPDQIWTQNTADVEGSSEGNDRFGYALESADFNCDGSDDLAIGALEEVKTPNFGGSVNVIYGSQSLGLSATNKADQIWTQDSSGIEDLVETDDKFGSSLAAGDFNNDGNPDLAIGVPSEDVSSNIVNAGAVNVIYGSTAGLSSAADQIWHQDSPNIEGGAEVADFFGFVLTTGDFNNDGKGDLAIGVPGEDLETTSDAGMVNVIYGSSSGLSATTIPDQTWHQNNANIEDSNEKEDKFASALS